MTTQAGLGQRYKFKTYAQVIGHTAQGIHVDTLVSTTIITPEEGILSRQCHAYAQSFSNRRRAEQRTQQHTDHGSGQIAQESAYTGTQGHIII